MNDVITLAADPFPPYQYVDETGDIKGADYEVIEKAFAAMGWHIDVRLFSWDDVILSVRNESVMGMFQIQPTPEREREFEITHMLRNSETAFFSASSEYTRFSQVQEIMNSGIQIGVLKGYSYGNMIDSLLNNNKIIFENQRDLLGNVQRRKIPLGISDLGVGMFYKNRDSLNSIFPLKQLSFNRPLHLAFSKKNHDTVRIFNEGLKTISENGERAIILKAYNLV